VVASPVTTTRILTSTSQNMASEARWCGRCSPFVLKVAGSGMVDMYRRKVEEDVDQACSARREVVDLD